MTAASSLPAEPAQASDPALNGGLSQRIALRRSAALHLATALFIAVALAAVCVTAGARFGAGPAVLAGWAVFGVLSLAAVRHGRNQPGALKIGPEGLSIWNRAGNLRVQGRIVGCSQWSDSLLMLSIEEDGARLHRVLLAADMLERKFFRELAVLARRAAHV